LPENIYMITNKYCCIDKT